MKNQTSGTPARLRKFWFPILAFTPTMGVVEALRSDRPYAIRVSRLLIVFLAFTSLAIVALVTEYFTTRQMLSDITVAHQRLEMVMSSGKSVGWEWDLTSGRDSWFGDLRTMFGIQSETWSGHVEEFFRYVHAEDRERVSLTQPPKTGPSRM
jgi:hypothetical protein